MLILFMDEDEMRRLLIDRIFERLNSDKKLKKKLSGYSADRLPSKDMVKELINEYHGSPYYNDLWGLYNAVDSHEMWG